MEAIATPANLDSLDVIRSETYGAGFPHEAWAKLRRLDPVHRFELEGWDPFWAVTKHADIVWLSKQPDRFLNAPRMAMGEGRMEDFRRDNPERLVRHLLNMDAPDHRRYRKLGSPWFTPRRVARLEPRVREIAHALLDDTMEAGECDFVDRVAARLPLKVIAEILGVPEEDEDLILDLSNLVTGGDDPDVQKGRDMEELGPQIRLKIFGYFADLVARRRAQPTDDLGSFLANAKLEDAGRDDRSPDDARLPEIELLSYYALISVAGHETTRNATSGGMLALLERPDQFARLQAEPALLKLAVEEILRWTSPVIHFCRTSQEDYELGGHRIPAGEVAVLFYPSANRDEDVFEAASDFAIDRRPNPHIAFGIGEHYCMGANLARLELRAFFSVLAERAESMELAGPPQHLQSSFVGGVKHLPWRHRLRKRD